MKIKVQTVVARWHNTKKLWHVYYKIANENKIAHGLKFTKEASKFVFTIKIINIFGMNYLLNPNTLIMKHDSCSSETYKLSKENCFMLSELEYMR